jgi:hypothetical protein
MLKLDIANERQPSDSSQYQDWRLAEGTYMKRDLILALALLSLLPLDASAGRRKRMMKEAIHAACFRDSQALCPEVKQGQSFQRCFIRNAQKLSSHCREVLQSNACSMGPGSAIKAAFPCSH